MTAHLFQLAIGPVQDLIERARRTRDLWFGSWLLSEISKAAALSIRPQDGKLIFPASVNLAEQTVANIIVAELHPGVDPEAVASAAKEAALRCWRQDFADPVYRAFQAVIRHDYWREQVDDIFEFYAAWVPFDPQRPASDHYNRQRQRLARLMAGRKNCRDFRPARGHDGVPKSSLDGLRETVLKDDKVEPWPSKIVRRLRVRRGEQLDVLGLVKRSASDDLNNPIGHKHYPSVSRVAADPWLRGIGRTEEGQQVLRELCRVCDELRSEGLLNRVDDREYPQYGLFPFEGSALYRTRHHELEEETGEGEDPAERFAGLRAMLSAVERYARAARLGAEPDPYAAVLVADGDRMGKAISAQRTPDEHRRFSEKLAQFARDAIAVIREHQGVLVYSGGDDVLAFVPVDRVLACARALHGLFEMIMAQALPQTNAEELPTLSVGVAIGHFLENLEDLLAYGRAAEKDAKKPNRDGLAVHLHKRGGAPVCVRKQWKDNLDERLRQAARWFLAGAVSNRTPYELDRLAEVYDRWPEETLGEAIRADAARVIDRKRPPGTDNQMKQIREGLHQRVHTPSELSELAAELLIARQLAVALRQSGGENQ
jgi:CRISPR-associated protein Cmr2